MLTASRADRQSPQRMPRYPLAASSYAIHVTASRSGTAGQFPHSHRAAGSCQGPAARRDLVQFVFPAWSPFCAGPVLSPGGCMHCGPRTPVPGDLRRSGRGGALAAAALGGACGGEASQMNSGLPPGRRAPRAAARGNLGRRGTGRRRRLAEGRRDQLVEFLAQPLRVSEDHVRERGVYFTDGQVVHADQTPQEPSVALPGHDQYAFYIALTEGNRQEQLEVSSSVPAPGGAPLDRTAR